VDSKLLARIGAVIFVAIAITMTAIEMSRAPEPPRAGRRPSPRHRRRTRC
jgi:conjugative transfer region protein TrbK